MVKHGQAIRRSIHVVNLDPAAEYFDYPVLAGKYYMLFIQLVQTQAVCEPI